MITGWILSGSEQHPLFDEGLPGMEVSACTVTTAMDEVDSAELALPASNKAARSLLHKNSVVEIRDDGTPVFIGDIATVTVHIKKIREKIEFNTAKPQYIETIWGVGYRFKV